MDGTLTKPYANFKFMTKMVSDELRKPVREPLFESLTGLSESERARAMRIIESVEDEMLRNSEENDGASKVLQQLRESGIKIAILTRNSRKSLDSIVAKHCFAVDFLASRDDGPLKPSAESVTRIIEHFQLKKRQCILVGDFKYDIEAARNAEIKCVLLTNGSAPSFRDEADYAVGSLSEAVQIICPSR